LFEYCDERSIHRGQPGNDDLVRLETVRCRHRPRSVFNRALRLFQIRMNLLARELRQRSADIGTLFVETLLGFRLVACFTSSEYELERFRGRNGSFVSTLLRFQSTSMLGQSVPGTLFTAATIAVFVYASQRII